jgi:uncharacterized protein YjbI with pentapeptide repeats
VLKIFTTFSLFLTLLILLILNELNIDKFNSGYVTQGCLTKENIDCSNLIFNSYSINTIYSGFTKFENTVFTKIESKRFLSPQSVFKGSKIDDSVVNFLYLDYSNIEDTDITDSSFDQIYSRNTWHQRVNIRNVKVETLDLSDSIFIFSTISESKINTVILRNTNLEGTDLSLSTVQDFPDYSTAYLCRTILFNGVLSNRDCPKD